MNKITKLFALLLIAGTVFTSCRDDDNIVVADRETLNQTVYADEGASLLSLKFCGKFLDFESQSLTGLTILKLNY
jgi:hypothetical protein